MSLLGSHSTSVFLLVFKFVNGVIPVPDENDPTYEAWEMCNTMVISWITKSLCQEIAHSVIEFENAQEIWDDLKNRFSKGNHFRTSDLMQLAHSMKQGERTVSGYYTDFKTIWDELESMRSIPSCICSTKCNCSYELIKGIKRQREIEYVICFLKGLNDQYTVIKSQILALDPLPPITKAFSMVKQQEGQIVSDSKVLFNIAESNQNWKGQGRGNRNGYVSIRRGKTNGRGSGGNSYKVCTFCGKNGHTVDTCYYKHGFPPNHKFKFKNTANVNNMVSNDCETSLDDQLGTFPEDDKKEPSIRISPEQYAQLAALFQKTPQPLPHIINQVSHAKTDESSTPQSQQNSGYDYLEDDWTC